MKLVLIIGGSASTWSDVEAATNLVGRHYGPFDEVVAVNDSGHDYPRVDHWISFHGDKFDGWQAKRQARGYLKVKNLWTSTYGRLESAYERRLGQLGVKRINYTGGGSSGLVAAFVSLVHLRASHVILAGIPMDAKDGHYHSHGPWKEAERHRAAWKEKIQEMIPRTTSMGGWTASQLGKPSREWLEEVHETPKLELT